VRVLTTESKVILFSYDPDVERVCAAAMRSCYSPHASYDLYLHTDEKTHALEDERPLDTQRVEALLQKAIELEHHDILEHGLLTFDLEHVSRACTHQLVRHRLASFSQQSQLYVKITRSHGHIKPPAIREDVRVPVQIRDKNIEMSYEDMIDAAAQMEEGLLKAGVRAEDARYVRPNAAVTNIVASMNPRQLLHVLELRCAADAQWEIRDLAWAMFACAKLIAPNIFKTLSSAKTNSALREKIAKLDLIVKEMHDTFVASSRGELLEIPLDQLTLQHPMRAFVKKLQ
jgi:thymidylate synthase (FAD)